MAQIFTCLLHPFLACLVYIIAQTLAEVEFHVTFDERGQSHQRLLLILLDGFRYDYLEHRDFDFPGFQKVIRRGARPKYMIPDFPTLSYPNYYSFMTGEIFLFFFLSFFLSFFCLSFFIWLVGFVYRFCFCFLFV